MKLKYEMVDLKKIKPFKGNPKTHPERQLEKIRMSIKEFGFNVPLLLDKNNEIIAGHGRYLVAQDMDLKKVPVLRADHLSKAQVKAFRIADNESSISDWNDELLAIELAAIEKMGLELDLTGLDQKMIDKLKEDPEEKNKKPDVEFTEELHESNNYIVMFFDNDIDWLQAMTLFELKTVKALDSRPGFEKAGIGRVVNGAKALNKIMGE